MKLSLKAKWQAYIFAILSIAIVTGLGVTIRSIFPLNPENLVMLYLLAVVVTALNFGFVPAVFVSVVSVLAFNFFFVPPQLTLHVDDAQYLITFSALFFTGLLISNLTAQAKQAAESAQEREQYTARLYSLSQELASSIALEEILQSLLNHLQASLHVDAFIYLAEAGELSHLYGNAKHDEEVANWVWQHSKSAGQGTAYFTDKALRYFPLKTAETCFGLVGVHIKRKLEQEQESLAEAFIAQVALAVEANQLGEKAKQAELLREKEKLQTILLNSISHDLRTPLVSITGALTSLRDESPEIDAAIRHDLVEGAYQEAERLNRLVGNLLELSRLQAGSLKLKRELYDVRELISVARLQLRPVLERREVLVEIEPNLPLVSLDLVLFAQVLVNLLDNAAKYSAPEMPIEIQAHQAGKELRLQVLDRGIGIAKEDIPLIFQRFYRASGSHGRRGSGLGLSICEGIVELHGGRIQVSQREDGGTIFSVYLRSQAEEDGL